MNSLIIFCAQCLSYVLVAVFLLLLFFSKKDKISKLNFLIFSAISVFTARIVITETIRYFYYSPRPFMVLNNLNQLISHEPTGSFPSGHAAFFFALAMAVYLAPTLMHKWWGFVFFIGALLIGLTRILAGLHWPIDILAGALIGVFSSSIIYYLLKSCKKP